MNRKGLTLVELLVAMSILGIVLAALLSLTTGTLNFSAVSTSTSDRLRELSDVTGYMADSIRRASEVVTSGLTVNSASAPNSGICDISSTTTPCFSVVVPVVVDNTAIDKYVQLFYRIESRSSLPDTFKVADSWADANTFVIKEYRNVLCDSSSKAEKDAGGNLKKPLCDSPAKYAAKSSVTGANWALVLDGLTLSKGAGTYSPFAYASDMFTLQFRVTENRRGIIRYTPANEPYQLTVIKRN